MNKVQMGIIKKIIKDSVPELKSALQEIDTIKRDMEDIKLSLARIERGIQSGNNESFFQHGEDFSDNIDEQCLTHMSESRIVKPRRRDMIVRFLSKIFNRDNTELFLSIASLAISISAVILVINWL